MNNVLIKGDPLEPSSSDVIAQFTWLKVGEPVPEGWRVLDGNTQSSEIARVVMRYEIECNTPIEAGDVVHSKVERQEGQVLGVWQNHAWVILDGFTRPTEELLENLERKEGTK